MPGPSSNIATQRILVLQISFVANTLPKDGRRRLHDHRFGAPHDSPLLSSPAGDITERAVPVDRCFGTSSLAPAPTFTLLSHAEGFTNLRSWLRVDSSLSHRSIAASGTTDFDPGAMPNCHLSAAASC